MNDMKTKFTRFFSALLYGCLLVIWAALPKYAGAQKKAVAHLGNPVVYINLMLPSADSLLLVDGTGCLYDNQFSAGVDYDDAGKLSNMNENICLLRDGEKLAIEARPVPKQNDTLFIHMWGVFRQTYNLQINIKSVLRLLPTHVWLVDNYLHTQTPVSLFGKTLYPFTPAADTGSYINRFMLVFNRNEKQDNHELNTGDIKTLLAGGVTVYPNPVTGNRVWLHFKDMPKGKYSVCLNNLSGEVFARINIMHTGDNKGYYLPLNSVYTHGIYNITVSNINSGKTIHLPVIIN
jgi:hypothetical protein